MSKTIPKSLLEAVADANFYSGEKLGELLGVSRVAVWKQLQKMSELGLSFESVKGKGYRLSQPIVLLSLDSIRQQLSHADFLPDLSLYDVIDSTNTELLRRLASENMPAKGSCVMAEMQEQGKGRRGRQWISPFAQNIYLSMSWDFEQGVGSLDGLSLLVGLSVVEALKKHLQHDFKLKWPNDILVNNRKLAGILLEVVGDSTGLCHVVMGIGINVNYQNELQQQTINQPWVSLAELEGRQMDRNVLIAAIIEQLMTQLPQFEKQGFASYREQWQQYDAFAGQEVVIQMGERFIFGRSLGVSKKGELKLETDKGVQQFNGGEVSLRRKQP